jgi:hypothetical protein
LATDGLSSQCTRGRQGACCLSFSRSRRLLLIARSVGSEPSSQPII